MAPSTVQKNDPLSTAQVLRCIQRLISPELFELWFTQSDRICLVDGIVVVNATTQFELKRLQKTFGAQLRQVAMQLLGNANNLKFVVAQTGSHLPSEHSQNAVGTSPRLSVRDVTQTGEKNSPVHHPAPRPQRYRLTDFAFGEGSEMLQTAVQEVLRTPGRFSPLYFYGPAGCGKTHLAEAIAFEFRKRPSANRAICITAEHFTNSFIQCIRGGGLPLFRRKFRDLDLLVVDDVQFLGGKRATLGEFQYTLDFLVRTGKQVILTADRAPADSAAAMGESSSRLAAGLVCQIGWPDKTGREKIVRRFSAERRLSLDDDAVELLASRISGDSRKLSGAINRIVAATLATGMKSDRQTAQTAVGDLFGLLDQQTNLANIEQTVCECLGVNSPDLRSSRRTRRVSTARMLAMWLARKYTPNALSEIGDYFGGRSHSTVVAAQNRIDELIELGTTIEFSGRTCRLDEAVQSLKGRLQVS